MDTTDPDTTIGALAAPALHARLARTDWERDPEFVPTEQVFRLFRRAREAGDHGRIGQLSEALSMRLLGLARGFAVRSGIYPGNIDNLGQAAEEISQFIWECLVSRPKDAVHAEKYFGQLFNRRALDFQKSLLARKRTLQHSWDAMAHQSDDEDPDETLLEVPDLRLDANPEDVLAGKQQYAQTAARLQSILSKNEFSVYVMLNVEEMMVKDIAKALGVTPRAINNYKNAALDKIRKEFNK